MTGRSRNKLDDLQAGAADAAINLRTKNPYKWPKIDGYAWGENFTPPPIKMEIFGPLLVKLVGRYSSCSQIPDLASVGSMASWGYS